MERTALLIVDVQIALIEKHPFNELNFIKNLQNLIEVTRQEGIEIIYVQHDGGIGDELEKNKKGWEIHPDISPKPSEIVFNKKFNSVFKGTGLKKYLDSKGIRHIILVGMQTEYCIDTTCRVAFEYGYNLMIPKNTTTTYDNDFFLGDSIITYYETKIWNNRFAKVIPLEEVINSMKDQAL